MPTYALNANQCPPPIAPASVLYVADVQTGGGTVPVSKRYTSGSALASNDLNAQDLRTDLNSRYGGGGYGVCTGLVPTAPGSGLGLQITAGQALIDGVVEYKTTQTVSVPDNTARVWVWLMQNGTLTVVPTSLAPPVGNCCLLGSCTTSGGNITGTDLSGVVYFAGGNLWRQTADSTTPTDTPPSSLSLYTKTPGGIYLWTGTAHVLAAQGVGAGSGLNWKGAWSGATAYNVNDAVSLGGASYICILAHTNQTPPNATYWNTLALAGTNGQGVPVGGTTGQLLAKNSNTDYDTHWVSGAGAGTVTSVGLSMPADYSVANSPVTGAGTLTVTRTTQAANLFLAGPSSGAAAAPGYRAIVPGDLPPMGASGAGHQAGAVPDPGSVAGTTKFLREDGTWQLPPGGGGTGTVTSVALSAPGEISVSGSPITGSGTLALSWAAQSANLVFAGPSSGGATTPGFRALVMADLPQDTRDITIVIDGGGATIATGLKAYIPVDYPGTILQATLLADRTGSIIVNLWKCTYAQFDAGATHPVAGDKITGSAAPTISSAAKAQDSTLSGWTTGINAGDILAVNVDSVTSIQRATLTLKVKRTG